MRPPLPKVPHTVWEKWRLAQTVGDVKAIVEEKGISTPTVTKALVHKRASVETQRVITNYFAEKVKAEKKSEADQLAQFPS